MTSAQLTGQKRKRITETPSEPSFFNALSYDPLSIITRFISERPHVENWQDFINPSHLLAVLKSGDRLNTVVRDVVSAVGNCDVCRHSDPDVEAGLVQELSSSLRTLRVLWDKDERIPKYSFEALKNMSLRKAEFDIYCSDTSRQFPLDAALNACSNSLRELRIVLNGPCGKNEADIIAYRCPQLEDISIIAYEFDEPDLSSLWAAVGKTMTKLNLRSIIRPFSTGTELVNSIAEHCHRLEDVRLNHPRQNWLYKELGPQLKEIYFESYRCIPSPSELYETLKCCPNVNVNASLLFRYPIEETLTAMSSHLTMLSIRFGPSTRVLQLPRIRELNLGIPPRQTAFVKSFFYIPRPTLRKLSIDCYETEILEYVSKSTKNLTELHVRFAHFAISFRQKDFDNLLLANPSLRSFRLKYVGVQEWSQIEQFTVSQLNCLKDFKNFVEFRVVSSLNMAPSTPIRDACVPLRNKRVVVFVGDTKYLPT